MIRCSVKDKNSIYLQNSIRNSVKHSVIQSFDYEVLSLPSLDGTDLQMNRTPPKDKQERNSSRGEGPPSVGLCHATSPTPISLHKNLQLKFKLKTETLNDASALAHLNSLAWVF